MAKAKKTRDEWMTERRDELGLSWEEVAQAAGAGRETLRRIRAGESGHPRTIRNIEAALGWALGSLAAIDRGGRPTAADTNTLPAALLAGLSPGPLSLPEQLRALRREMGPAAFWREVGAMQAEEDDTESDRLTGT